MDGMKKRIIVAVTGASGAIYAKKLLENLSGLTDQIEEAGVVFSKYAREVWQYELGSFDPDDIQFPVYKNDDFFAPFASGSAGYTIMIVCPCSMGTLGRIASGVSNDLISRSADVVLKEQHKLILVPRESPYNLVHIRNMETITLAGGIIFPASPSFYSKPSGLDEAADQMTRRVLALAGFKLDFYSWGEKDPGPA